MKNWGGNITYGATQIFEPQTQDELERLIRDASRVRVCGSRHSFSRIADTDGTLISVAALRQIDHQAGDVRVVSIAPGATFGQLGTFLHERAARLRNFPSLPHVCVVGAMQTGTHGSGTQNVANDALAVTLLTSAGDVRTVMQNDRIFAGCIVSLGLLGVVARMYIQTEPTTFVEQEVYERVPLEPVLTNLDAVMTAAYSVSLFTNWQGNLLDQVWFKRDVLNSTYPDPLPFAFLGPRASDRRHPIAGVDPVNCTDQEIAGPAHERLPHFRHDAEPSSAGNELQAEYFVARSDAPAALQAIASVGPRLRDVLMISEVRTVLADDLWLSPAYQRDSVAIHFTLQPDEPAVLDVLAKVIEPALAPFNPRPHWGKLFCLPPDRIRSAYPMLPRFRQLCEEFDPAGKFRNDFADRYIFGNTP